MQGLAYFTILIALLCFGCNRSRADDAEARPLKQTHMIERKGAVEQDTASWTWLPSKVQSSERVHLIQMLDHDRGWAGTDRSLLKSTDGGRSWKRVSFPLIPAY